MKPINLVRKFFLFKNKKMNGIILLFIFIFVGSIGLFSIVIPSLLMNSPSDIESIEPQDLLNTFSYGPAQIISPNNDDSVSDLFYVFVNITNIEIGNQFYYVSGELRRYADNSLLDDLEFSLFPNFTLAWALVGSYAYVNDTYNISVWGDTSMSGSFYDTIKVDFNNSWIMSATLQSPSGTTSGIVPSTANISYPYPIRNAWLEVYTDPERFFVNEFQFYHKSLQNTTTYNISSFALNEESLKPSLIEVDSNSWSYDCNFACIATLGNNMGNLYFGNSTDGTTWNFTQILPNYRVQDPSLVQALDGTLYVIFEDMAIMITNSTDGGLTWSWPETITWFSDVNPSMIQLQNGSFLIAFIDYNYIYLLLNNSPSIMNSNWNSRTIYYAMPDEELFDPSLIQMSDSSIKLAFSKRGFEQPQLLHIINISSDLSWWSLPYLVTPFRNWGADEQSPSLVEAQDGNLFLVFSSHENAPHRVEQVFIINSTNYMNWSLPSPVTWNCSFNQNPCIIQRSDGKFMVAFESDRLGRWDSWEIFVSTFENMTICWNWTGFIPTYTMPNGSYFIKLIIEDIYGAVTESNELQVIFENPSIFSIECEYPLPESVVSGLITVQLDITSPYPIDWVSAWVKPMFGGNLSYIDWFMFNDSNGLWEQQWPSWTFDDGNYIIHYYAEDTYGANVYNECWFSILNPFGLNYTLLSPQPNKILCGDETFVINATSPSPIKWVSWRVDPWADKYAIYQGLIEHEGPWQEYKVTGMIDDFTLIEMTNGDLIMAYYAMANLWVSRKLQGRWTAPVYIDNNGYNPCLFQLMNGTIILAYEKWSAIYWTKSNNNGSTWEPTTQTLWDMTYSIYNPSLAQLPNGTIIMAYHIDEWDLNDYDIEIAVFNQAEYPTWTRCKVLNNSYEEKNPSLIRTIDNNFVIAFEFRDPFYNLLIGTALSIDNCSTFGDITIVTAGCYHEWQEWSNPSLIQTSEEIYVITCEADYSPWGQWQNVIFLFNSSDRVNWGVAKPIRNDTFYQRNYNDWKSCLLQLRNGTYLVAFMDFYYMEGIFFTTFEGFTEMGLWMITVNTRDYYWSGYQSFQIVIEDISHVEKQFPPHIYEWYNDDISPNYVRNIQLQVLPGANAILLKWEPNSDIDILGYRIYRSLTEVGFIPTQANYIGSTTDISYVDTCLMDNVNYFYIVLAEDKTNYLSIFTKIVNGTPFSNIQTGMDINIHANLATHLYVDEVGMVLDFIADNSFTLSINIVKMEEDFSGHGLLMDFYIEIKTFGLTGNLSGKISLILNEKLLSRFEEGSFAIYYWDMDKWVKLDSIYYPSNNTLIATIEHFSVFGAFGVIKTGFPMWIIFILIGGAAGIAAVVVYKHRSGGTTKIIVEKIIDKGHIKIDKFANELDMENSAIIETIQSQIDKRQIYGFFTRKKKKFITKEKLKSELSQKITEIQRKLDLSSIAKEFELKLDTIILTIKELLDEGTQYGILDEKKGKFYYITENEHNELISLCSKEKIFIQDISKRMEIESSIVKGCLGTLIQSNAIQGAFNLEGNSFIPFNVLLREVKDSFSKSGKLGFEEASNALRLEKEGIRRCVQLLKDNKDLEGYSTADNEYFITLDRLEEDIFDFIEEEKKFFIKKLASKLNLNNQIVIDLIKTFINKEQINGVITKNEEFISDDILEKALVDAIRPYSRISITELAEDFGMIKKNMQSIIAKAISNGIIIGSIDSIS
ncbi:MAG: exo-alpha-sialidase, partial [Promethearchaeota archaeon]